MDPKDGASCPNFQIRFWLKPSELPAGRVPLGELVPVSLVFFCLIPKLSLKIGSVNKVFLFWYFFRDKTFLFYKIVHSNFQNLFEKQFRENLTKFQLNQTIDRKNENNNCLNELNELKLCEVSRNSISNRWWKIQFSILKNKKVLFLKKYFLCRSLYICQEISKRWRLLS